MMSCENPRLHDLDPVVFETAAGIVLNWTPDKPLDNPCCCCVSILWAERGRNYDAGHYDCSPHRIAFAALFSPDQKAEYWFGYISASSSRTQKERATALLLMAAMVRDAKAMAKRKGGRA